MQAERLLQPVLGFVRMKASHIVQRNAGKTFERKLMWV
jgi:hypothetical protein